MKDRYFRPDQRSTEYARSWCSQQFGVTSSPSFLNTPVVERGGVKSTQVHVDQSIPPHVSFSPSKKARIMGGLIFSTWVGSRIIEPTPDISRSYGRDPFVNPVPFSQAEPLCIEEFNDPEKSKEALGYKVSILNPDGSVRNDYHSTNVVPMDVAKWATIASKLKSCSDETDTFYLERSKDAVIWLLTHVTKKGDHDEFDDISVDGITKRVSYAGTFYGKFDLEGRPISRSGARRGRGEATGISLDAIRAYVQQCPEFLFAQIPGNEQDKKVFEIVDEMAHALETELLDSDGRFYHSPDFGPHPDPDKEIHFGEENARMRRGLYAASEMLAMVVERYPDKKEAYSVKIANAKLIADNNFFSIQENGISVAQGHDLEGDAVWGLHNPADPDIVESRRNIAQQQVKNVDESELDLVTPAGLRAYDWQETTNPHWYRRLGYKIQDFFVGAAPTLDFAHANLMAGNIQRARDIVEQAGARQNDDGSIPIGWLPSTSLNLSYGDAGYTTDRYLEAQLLLGHINKKYPPPPKTSKIKRILGGIKNWAFNKVSM